MTLTASPPSSGCLLLCFMPPIIMRTIEAMMITIDTRTTIQVTAHSPSMTVTHGTASAWALEYMFMTSYPEPIAPIITPNTPSHMNRLGMPSNMTPSLLPVRRYLWMRSRNAQARCMTPMNIETFRMRMTWSNVSSATVMAPTSHDIEWRGPPSCSSAPNGAKYSRWNPNTSPWNMPAMAAAAPDIASSMPQRDVLPCPLNLKSRPRAIRDRPCPRSANIIP